ncbi:MAG TPA: hypothetical protein VGR73_11880 [Bryobacteraceae bacterium]|nr:hypothetical protein [Bryobacteraceae bacterium]
MRRCKAGFLVAATLTLPVYAPAQGGGRGAAPTGKAAAPVDLTGYWVSIVTEDWRYRMVTPKKGDFASVPLTAEGRKVGDAWDPAKDEAAGEQCKSYGAPALMRVPGRIDIDWQDDLTLKIETDAGTQTRLFHFGPGQPPTGPGTLQGFSTATWDAPPPPQNAGAQNNVAGGAAADAQARGGSLKVVTNRLKAGYLRKNGVPYSENALLTEYYTRTNEPNGDSWLIITTIVEDPQYLNLPFLTSTHFKKEANGSKWMPSPCTAR